MGLTAATMGTGRAWRIAWTDALTVAMACGLVAALVLRDPGVMRSLYAGAGVAVLCGIALHDLRTYRAPNRVVYPALGLLLAGSLVLGAGPAASAALGAVAAFAVFLLIAVLGRGAMGFGDAKVAAIAGAVVGLAGVVPMLLATHLAGGLVAALALGLGLRGRKDVVAFTPFLLLGAVVALWLTPAMGPS